LRRPVGGAAQRMAAGERRGRFAADETLDLDLQPFGEAPHPVNIPGNLVGLLVGLAMNFLLDALRGPLRQAEELDEIIGRIEGAAARFCVH
jgi:hypothetical protein